MPRSTARHTLAAVAVSALILAGFKRVFIDNRPGDVFLATLCSIERQYTVYVKGFSESKFRSIRVGMTVRQVEEI